ncbi:MAG TPA: T9SS type A sorting domain-containing protein [Chryseolinea sp.]|nr:T9SS type A sorting domain-containing protein [Chryseolinea sp.]
MFLLYQFFKKNTMAATAILLLTAPVFVAAQDGITTIEVSEPGNNKSSFRSEDVKMKLGSADKPYVLFGTDFQGSGGFYISFDLESRQTVRYQLVDMMGRQIAAEDLKEVLDQTYQVEAHSISSGAYIVRLVIDRTCYTEKIFFTP